jgi:hypothetical protein
MPAGDRSVVVPAAVLEEFLRSKGFERSVWRGEVVYAKRHEKDRRFVVSVYTTISDGSTRTRRLGEDSIKVSVFMYVDEATGRTRGVAKQARVFRTGTVEGVLERVYERMRAAYAACNDRIKAGEKLTSARRPPALDSEGKPIRTMIV